MQRIYNNETLKQIGKKVKVAGWVDTIRAHGKLVFLDLRDRTGILQVVCQGKDMKDIKEEFVLAVEGKVAERPKNMLNSGILTGAVELQAQKIAVLAKSEPLPFETKEGMNLSLPVLLDFRCLTLRNEKIKAIFDIEEKVVESFRAFLKNNNFIEVQTPTIVPTVTEGGAEVFTIDYYGKKAYLAQSPQLYKQMLVGVFERVFTVAHAYRAEPSITTRHLSEYIGLDVEFGFIDSWTDLTDLCESLLKSIFSEIKKTKQSQLKIFQADVPDINKIPRLKMRQAQEIIFQRVKRDHRDLPDLDPEDEKEICQWAKENYGAELVFITHYPTKKRPFYTFPDPDDPEFTLSFDVLFRGLEIVTGGQRINDYETLRENVKKWGNKEDDFVLYLQAFKYGMPKEGGFCLGLERIVKQLLGLANLREASFFPRDMSRIDIRLNPE